MITLSIILIGLMSLVGMWVLTLRVVVPTNEVHIVQTGKATISYGNETKDNKGNVYYEFPSWIPYIGVTKTILPISVFDVTLTAYEAYDVGRLPFLVDIKAFFRISDSNKAAQRISTFEGQSGLRAQITDIVRGSVRSIMANSELENIMSERSVYGTKFTEMVKEQLANWGVEAVKNIELMDVRDASNSDVIANIMAKKSSEIEMQSRTEVAVNMRKAKEAEILAKQEVDLKQEEANQQVGMKQADVSREVGLAKQKAEQEIKEQAKITKEKEMEVLKVQEIRQAEIKKEASIVNADAAKAVILRQAEAQKEKTILDAQAEKEQIELKAEAELQMNLKEAEGIQAKGQAEAESKKAMELASVTAQTTLAEKIGENESYQNYLINLEQIKALAEVGIEQAKNLANATIKINAMSNDVPAGLSKVTDVFTPKGGLNIAGALENLASSDLGKQVVNKLLANKPE